MIITPPDIVIIIILSFFTINGFRHGFIVEISRIISLVGGFIMAAKFHKELIPFIQPYIENESMQVTAAYLGIFILAVVIITIIAKILQKFFELILLGWLNRLLGVLLGMLKGFLIVSLLIFIIQSIPFKLEEGDTLRKKLEKESVMFQICDHVKELVILTVPLDHQLNNFQEKIKKYSDEKNVQEILQPSAK